MSNIKDFKITDTAGKKVADLPGSTLSGTIEQNKEAFDKLGELIIDHVNDSMDYLYDKGVDNVAEGVQQVDAKADTIDNKAIKNADDIAAVNTRVDYLQSCVGTPLVAATVAGMTDHDKIYVYTGSEAGYTAGDWYYWNGAAWADGGVYNSVAFDTDTTLALSGRAADAKVTGDEITDLKEDLNYKVNQPLDEHDLPTNGVAGQSLRTKGNGRTEWADVGLPTDEQTAQAISDWLDNHPEATTTVQDHSLTYEKLVNNTLGFVMPEMFGAVGDGVTDDYTAMAECFLYHNIKFTSGKTYRISSGVNVLPNSIVAGNYASVVVESGSAFTITGDNVTIGQVKIYSVGDNIRYGVEISTNTKNARVYDVYGEKLKYNLIMDDGINSIVYGCYALECGWDCVTNYSSSVNAIIQNCTAIRCGRHGFSTEANGSTWINCYAEDIGFIDGEGHSSFHFERASNCAIINCKARYTSNHKKIGYTGNYPFYGFRLDTDHSTPSINNSVNGLEIIYENGFSVGNVNAIKPLMLDCNALAIRPKVEINGLRLINNTAQSYECYLGIALLSLKNFKIKGRFPIVQKSDYGIITDLMYGEIDLDDKSIYFYEAPTIAQDVHCAFVKAKNCKALVRGRLVNCLFENCYIENSETSFSLTQTTGDSTKKSSGNIIKNNEFNNLDYGVRLGWWDGTLDNVIAENVFEGTIDTILLGNYCGVYFYDNIQRGLTYTTGKTNVTVTTTPPSLTV